MLSPCAQVIFWYFLPEAVGSATGLYFLHLCMDKSETLGESLKKIFFSAI